MILTTVLRMLDVKIGWEVSLAPVRWDLWEMDRHVKVSFFVGRKFLPVGSRINFELSD